MYCRICGSLINDKAVICVKCKSKPLLGRSYCQNCGARTTQQQTVCSKCGMKLKFEIPNAEKLRNRMKKEMDGCKATMRILKWFLIVDAVFVVICLGILIYNIVVLSELEQYSGMFSNYYVNQASGECLYAVVVLFGDFLIILIELIAYRSSRSKYKKLQKKLDKIGEK